MLCGTTLEHEIDHITRNSVIFVWDFGLRNLIWRNKSLTLLSASLSSSRGDRLIEANCNKISHLQSQKGDRVRLIEVTAYERSSLQ